MRNSVLHFCFHHHCRPVHESSEDATNRFCVCVLWFVGALLKGQLCTKESGELINRDDGKHPADSCVASTPSHKHWLTRSISSKKKWSLPPQFSSQMLTNFVSESLFDNMIYTLISHILFNYFMCWGFLGVALHEKQSRILILCQVLAQICIFTF